MLMNEKNKEMERWESLVTLLSIFCFCLFCDATGSPCALCVGSGFRGHLVGVY